MYINILGLNSPEESISGFTKIYGDLSASVHNCEVSHVICSIFLDLYNIQVDDVVVRRLID